MPDLLYPGLFVNALFKIGNASRIMSVIRKNGVITVYVDEMRLTSLFRRQTDNPHDHKEVTRPAFPAS